MGVVLLSRVPYRHREAAREGFVGSILKYAAVVLPANSCLDCPGANAV